MKSSLLVAFVAVGLITTLSAQEYHKSKAKSAYEEPKAKSSAVPVKTSNPSASTAQQLHQAEQQSKRVPSDPKSATHQARVAPVGKTEVKSNPPIRFGAASGGHDSMTNQGKNPYKGRVRQKGGGRG